MGSLLVHAGTTGVCMHGGTLTCAPSSPRVRVCGNPVLTTDDQDVIIGCPFQVPPAKPQPCVEVRFTPATRLRANSKSVALFTGTGSELCLSVEKIPQGPPIILTIQNRVRGV